ncbi:TRAP transporter substrate-binding protein [Bosea caraganae]|uniref:TRAP transporter substrate-binding protein n=1 Tax=Bosea caraganae TaxID=2763117 RepID=A0A370L719_9HYPH|nr:TRAP transporter substrate-binding protein [Bosea caraganae]RDJ25402.1 TRAP transporter substrate-binding protein [Bosea caraganae]RDJ25813.1 TRAP transporter substrate-binding protein [Bosea caraganae]
MTLTRRTTLKGAGAGIALFSIGNPAFAQAARLRFAHPHPESDSWHKAALTFAEQVKTRTQGRYEVQVFPNGSLGSDSQTISAVRGGSLDICLTGNPFFTGLAPKLNVLDLPFLFQSRKHAGAVMDGPIGDGLRRDLEGSNLKALSTWEIGWRNLTNSKRPITVAADLKGLKIRTTPNPAHIRAFQLLGAIPTPMAFTELFTALETGAVDGQENPVTLILNAKFNEVQKHLSLTRHAFTTGPVVMNKAKFDAHPADVQKLLVEIAAACAVQQRQMNEDTEAGSLDALKKAGMQAVENPDRDSFAKVVQAEVEKEFVGKFGGEVLEQIKKVSV